MDLVIDLRPVSGCGCVLLPPGLSWEDVTTRGMSHPDLGPFFAYGTVDFDPSLPMERLVDGAASEVQRLAMAMIWTRIGIGGWPLCPIHKTHPLWPHPDRGLGAAVWECRSAGYRVPIGKLSEAWA